MRCGMSRTSCHIVTFIRIGPCVLWLKTFDNRSTQMIPKQVEVNWPTRAMNEMIVAKVNSKTCPGHAMLTRYYADIR